MLSRRLNRRDDARGFYAALSGAMALAVAGTAALLAGPWLTGLEPTSGVYPAIVWLLACWAGLHVFTGLIMQAYCLASRLAGRLTARHDMDLANTELFWHFTVLTALATVAVIAGFPPAAR
jgi:cytochrome c oxidase subunit I+III